MIPINGYKNIFLLYTPHNLQYRSWYEWKGSKIISYFCISTETNFMSSSVLLKEKILINGVDSGSAL
jgi:hypothetical protein